MHRHARARRGRRRRPRSARPGDRDRRAGPSARARPAPRRARARRWSWPRRPSGWRRHDTGHAGHPPSPTVAVMPATGRPARLRLPRAERPRAGPRVQRGDFTLKSGKRSEWFIDAKQTTCPPEGMLLVADALLAVIPDDVTALGGLTMGADAAAFAIAAIAAARGRMLGPSACARRPRTTAGRAYRRGPGAGRPGGHHRGRRHPGGLDAGGGRGGPSRGAEPCSCPRGGPGGTVTAMAAEAGSRSGPW